MTHSRNRSVLLVALSIALLTPTRLAAVPGRANSLTPALGMPAVPRSVSEVPPPSSQRRLRLVKVIRGDITPKSVGWSRTGLVFAQNMMYRHTVTVYGPKLYLVKTIHDTVRLSRKGYPQYDGWYKGAPVEVAFSPDRQFAYVTNYSMYGPDLRHPGDDDCSPSDGIDPSFVYRIGLERLRIGKVIKVGSVPKVVAVTPNNRFVLVTNWCSYTLSIVSVARVEQIRQIRLGRYPRGIAVDPESRIAYVAVMGSTDIAKVNLRTFRVHWIRGVGSEPRALVMSPDGAYLYATLNGEGSVVKIDLATDRVIDRAFTGREPRSLTMAPDGLSLYLVNYESQTTAKIRTADMKILQTVSTNVHPIGVTYDGPHHRLWVACYSGSIMVFKDALPK